MVIFKAQYLISNNKRKRIIHIAASNYGEAESKLREYLLETKVILPQSFLFVVSIENLGLVI